MCTAIESYYIPVLETLFLKHGNQFYSSLCLCPISLSSLGEGWRWGCKMLPVVKWVLLDRVEGWSLSSWSRTWAGLGEISWVVNEEECVLHLCRKVIRRRGGDSVSFHEGWGPGWGSAGPQDHPSRGGWLVLRRWGVRWRVLYQVPLTPSVAGVPLLVIW